MRVLETWRPYGEKDLGKRMRIIWEGSEYRGRGRQSVWDGTATLTGNRFERFAPINLWNIDKPLKQPRPEQLAWSALTTGGFGGADVTLAERSAGRLMIDTPLVKTEVPIDAIGLEDHVLETNGGIARRMRMFRLPDTNDTKSARLTRRIKLSSPSPSGGGSGRGRAANEEDALYACVTLEDGHRIWSSPVYLLR
jgi:hypothetical protein